VTSHRPDVRREAGAAGPAGPDDLLFSRKGGYAEELTRLKKQRGC